MPVATQKAPFEVKGFLLLVGLSVAFGLYLLFQAVGFIDPTQIHSTDLRSSSARTKERRAKAGYAKMHLLKFKSSVI